MKRLAKIAWVTAGALALAAVLGITLVSAREGSEIVAEVTLAFTILAALAATFGAVITLLGNRAAARHQQELDAKQGQMAEDIGRLAELTESSLEEARALRPEPIVRFLVGRKKEPVDNAVLHRRRLVRELDVERILAHEREQVLATLPRQDRGDNPPSASEPESHGKGFLPLPAFNFLFSGAGPITEEERKEFDSRVEKYADALRKWLQEYEAWRKVADLLFVTHLRFENRGRVPARDVVVQLHFPDAFETGDDLPELYERPGRPRFQRRTLADLAGLYNPAITIPNLPRQVDLPPIQGNVSSPRYRHGSLIVEMDIDRLLHGIPEETDEPLMLRVLDDRDFVIPWQIHAENLAEPATGELTLKVVTELEEGSPITSLDELLATGGRDDEDDDEDG